jgi:Bacterial Ig-like domain
VGLGSTEVYIEGIATGFVRGDRVLITAPRPEPPGALPTLAALPNAVPRTSVMLDPEKLKLLAARTDGGAGVDISILDVTDVVPEPERGRTRLELHALGKSPPLSKPPAPTDNPPVPDPPFIPAEPPPLPPIAPAKLEDPIMVLVAHPLTAEQIRDRVLKFAWDNPGLILQLSLLGWNPAAVIDFINRARIGLDLGPTYEWVEVVPARDITRPKVLEDGVFPAAGSEAAADTVIVVRFSEPMDKASAEAAVTVSKKDDATHPLPFDFRTYDERTGSVRLKPQGSLASTPEGIEYQVNVTATAHDTAKPVPNLLAGPVTTPFVVRNRQRPELQAIAPVGPEEAKASGVHAEATDVHVEATVSATYSLELVNVTADTFFLRDATGTRVAADRVASNQGQTVTLKPRAPLARSMRYTATLTEGVTDKADAPIFPVEWSFTTVPRVSVAPDKELVVYGFREKTGFFGNNAPRWESLPKPAKDTQRGAHDPWKFSWDDPGRSVWVDSQGSSLGGDTVHLDREVQDLEVGGWAIFETATGAAAYYITNASAGSVADYGISGRSSRLVLSQRDGRSPCEGAGAPPDFRVRDTAAHVRSERLKLIELPIDEPLHAGDTQIVLDNMVVGLEKGRLIALRGELVDLPGAIGNEILVLKDSLHSGGFTTLILKSGLKHGYVRRTVTMSANVVPATHGETVAREVLGGGDGSQANQRFVLRKPPLTYVSAPTPSGADSALEVRVDSVRWDEAPVLHGLGPRSRAYIVRRSDDGIPAVVFGDGEQGARPPTGAENIVATYRTGIGAPGLLGAGRLTLLRERPLGIAGVTNPLPTDGAADPETRDAARENAPLTVLTMERIVSLRDFEDFARAFAGIGKAQALAIWRGAAHVVHLTVAPATADVFLDTSALFGNLGGAVRAASEPGLAVQIDPYHLQYFDLEATVRVDPAYRVEDVLGAARVAVLAAFSFHRRSFGQPVTAAEVIHVIEAVPGVVATYLKSLYQFAADKPIQLGQNVEHPLDPVLFVRQAHLEGSKIAPAELLLVNPAGVTITERTG